MKASLTITRRFVGAEKGEEFAFLSTATIRAVAQGVIGIAQLPALQIVAGIADNVLKPMLLGRGVDAPMPVILLGALGGMVSGGILGMFIGASFTGSVLSNLYGLGGDAKYAS